MKSAKWKICIKDYQACNQLSFKIPDIIIFIRETEIPFKKKWDSAKHVNTVTLKENLEDSSIGQSERQQTSCLWFIVYSI